MVEKGFIWECDCGHIEHRNEVPEDCPKCLRVGKFSPVPEDEIEEKKAEEILSITQEDEEELLREKR